MVWKYLLRAAIILTAIPAHAQLLTTGVGCSTVSCQPTVVASTYTGPGDVVAAQVWYGLRGYSRASASGNHPAVNLTRASDSHTCDINLASNGNLGNTANCSTGGDNGTAVATWCNATTCSVDKAYDQTQGNTCSSATCDISQATAANQPAVVFSCISTFPCVQPTSGQSLTSANTLGTGISQQFTITAVAERINNFTSQQTFAPINNTNVQFLFGNTANFVGTFYGSAVMLVAATDSVFHSFSAVANAASSTIGVDGTYTNNAPNPGSNSPLSTDKYQFFATSVANNMTGDMTEGGLYTSGLSTANQTSLCRNDQGYYGSGNFGATC